VTSPDELREQLRLAIVEARHNYDHNGNLVIHEMGAADAAMAVVTPELERLTAERDEWRLAAESEADLLDQEQAERRTSSLDDLEHLPEAAMNKLVRESLRDSATSEASQEAIEWAESAIPLANEANDLIEGNDAPPAAGEADTTPRVWRDCDGDTWREVEPGSLALVANREGMAFEVDHQQLAPIERVWQIVGPLVEVLPNAEQEADK
jgi:hypothetical protein